jgi:hypothetical protein
MNLGSFFIFGSSNRNIIHERPSHIQRHSMHYRFGDIVEERQLYM